MVVNVDETTAFYEGTAYLHPTDPKLPKAQVRFRTPNKESRCQFRTEMMAPLHPETHDPVPWDSIKERYNGAAFADYADVEAEVSEQHLKFKWRSSLGLEGQCTLPRSAAHSKSNLTATTVTWNQFKAILPRFGGNHDFIFRGQSEPWRLRTAFHRHGRADLNRFLFVDLPMLHKYLSGLTRHYFDIENPRQNAAFLSLAQHHGYPTNLLDWTRSPYVAAFFAFRGVPSAGAIDTRPPVRIFAFDAGRWSGMQQYHVVSTPMLHLSIMDVLAIENQRLLPQQAVALISSVDDIEDFIEKHGQQAIKGGDVLQAFDIAASERDAVLDELRFMGITAGAMFPGLDGVCEELKDRNFRLR